MDRVLKRYTVAERKPAGQPLRRVLAQHTATAFWMLTRRETGDQPRHLELETTLSVRDSTAPSAS
jgi:hypothetical protein